MSNLFGELNFSVSFKPTSAFPLDSRIYFTSLADAQAAALTAESVGSTETTYYIGQKLLVDDGVEPKWYQIQQDRTLKEEAVDIPAVLYEEQELTEEQKEQTRTNIGFSEDDAIALAVETGIVSPITAEDGSIYTDENGFLYSL